MADLIVQKYGGSSLATPKQILSAANNIQRLTRNGDKAIVVVSAMGTTTNDLITLAYQISSKPKRREFDMLLSTGERVSMALLSMALHDCGIESISFTGSQAGVFTDSLHSHARIIDLKPIRVEQELEKGKVIVLAGFQGVDPNTKEITTLGRGGSDTTAISMAAHFKAKRCEMLKDVSGFLNADPKYVSNAKLIPWLDYQCAENMCFWGSKLLHLRSISLAKNLKVPLFIGNSKTGKLGTQISETTKDHKMFENDLIYSMSHHNQVMTLSVKESSLTEALQSFDKDLTKRELPFPQVLASAEDTDSRIMFTADKELLESIETSLKAEKKYLFNSSLSSSVSLHGSEAAAKNILNRGLARLEELQIPVQKVFVQPSTVTFFIEEDNLNRALTGLDNLLG